MNQDSSAVVLAEDEQAWATRGHVLMVADGMGAHAAGELASKLAVDNLPHLYNHNQELTSAEALEKALVDTNSEIHRRGLANLDFRAMGTTASVLVLLPQGALIGHVGDSRVYRLRGQQLEQLTFDHSLQWELRALKIVAEGSDFAKTVPKNVITRSLGPNANVVVDLEGPFPLEIGDTFLICSDGLSGQIEDREIGSLLSYLQPEEAAAVLVDLANLRGGPDNITLVIAKVAGPGLATTPSAAECKPTGYSTRADAGSVAAWVVTGVCWLLACALWFADQTLPAILLAVAGAAALVVGLVTHFRGAAPAGKPAAQTHRLGNAPYVSITCSAGNEFVQSLATTLNELREAAIESGWQVRWNEFEHLCRKADAACEAEDFPAAVQSYAKSISFMMHELRSQQNRKASDSGLDL
ncbi:MAG: protein phosphatase 2C domain-containing protein [Pirellulaceae bacterium]|nr:protein phosphatase 2C domain-containing protein [Pirellulaceae bacterium]MCU0978709.1 protein phosphatase 2C domain-containing protein [Pirellulaceae bacterium]